MITGAAVVHDETGNYSYGYHFSFVKKKIENINGPSLFSFFT